MKFLVALLFLSLPVCLTAQLRSHAETATLVLESAPILPVPRSKARDTIRLPYHAYIPKHSLIVGCASAGSGVRVRQSLNSPWETANSYQFDPRLAWMFTERLCLGAEGTYGWASGTLVDDFSFFGYGFFGRYYLFTKRRADVINHERIGFFGKGQLFKKADDRQRRLFAHHLFPFIELGAGWSNVENTRTLPIIHRTASEPHWRILLGMDIRLWKFIFLEASYIKEFYPGNRLVPTRRLGARVALDFVIPFPSKKP